MDEIELHRLLLLDLPGLQVLGILILFDLGLLFLIIGTLVLLQKEVFKVGQLRHIFVHWCKVDQLSFSCWRSWQPRRSVGASLALHWRANTELNALPSALFEALIRVENVDLLEVFAKGNGAFHLETLAAFGDTEAIATRAMTAARLEDALRFISLSELTQVEPRFVSHAESGRFSGSGAPELFSFLVHQAQLF